MRNSFKRGCAFAGTVLLFTGLMSVVCDTRAQVLYGSVVGTVVDPEQSAVPKAVVRLTNTGTNQSRETVTDDNGNFSYTSVAGGTYDINVTKDGFQIYTLRRLNVTPDATVRVDAALRVGGLQEAVEVSAAGGVLQTDSAEVRSEINSTTLVNIPVNVNRNYQSLLITVPGVTPPTTQHSVAANPARGLSFNVNGTTRNSNAVRIDGALANNVWLPHVTAYVPSLEAIEAVSVITGSAEAEQGLSGGSAVNVQIKSGTNELHGSLFGFHADNALKAKPFFLPAGQQKPKYINNQVGGSLGGPILRDKLFYFGSWEGSYNRQSADTFATVPTAAIDSITARWVGRAQPCYQPLGDLRVYFENPGEATDYTRELDLTTAISAVRYKQSGVVFTREFFASHPDEVIVMRFSADRPESFNFRAAFSSVHPTAKTRPAGTDVTVMTGQVPGFALRRELEFVEKRSDQWKYPEIFDESGKRRSFAKQVLYGDEIGGRGMRFEARLRAIVSGGDTEAANDGLRVRRASEVLLILSAGTSFNGFDKSPSRQGADPAARSAADLERATKKTFAALRQAHVADYKTLFDRVSLTLGEASDQGRSPTDERITKFANDQDPALATLYFQFGRYLMIAGSRPGGQPLNLQGIWNPHVIPPWAGAYTTNINAQMNYWPAEVTNLAECHAPLFRMIRELAVTGGEVAHRMYHRRGWVEHHNTTIWRDAQPVDNTAMPAFWPMGGAWLCEHLWEHYLFTGDREFLAREAYPAIKGAAEFCSDWLVDDGRGRLVTAAGNSPEINFHYVDAKGEKKTAGISMGPTMDLAIVRELFTNCIRAGEILNRDPELRAELKAKLEKLLPFQIGSRGQLQEWPEDVMEIDPEHRHISHLYALHPSNQITRRGTPKQFEAARRTLELRGDEGTGWSRAWKINFWARMEDGDHAYKLVRNLLQLAKSGETRYDRGGVLPNLLCSHPPFQIDGNFGGTAGIAEMLVQSHAGEIHLLPALPRVWAAGQVSGLCARGGFVVDMTWRRGKLSEARIHSKLGNPCVLRYEGDTAELKTSRGRTYQLDGSLKMRRGAAWN